MTPSTTLPAEGSQPQPTIRSQRVEELVREHQLELYRRSDRIFVWLMGAQWLAGVGFALWVSPRAWVGSASQIHVHVWAALFLGGSITALPLILARLKPAEAITRHTIGVAQMLMGALLIHLTGGRIETHFHVFVSMAFLAFYRDWRVLVPATLVVAADHLLRGIFWPQSVYGVFVASHWRWLEHASWVIFEDVILIVSCIGGANELRRIAEHTASLEAANTEQSRLAIQQAELVSRLRISQQEAEASTRAKSEFVANMSHELRTPLNAITLYTDMLLEGAEEDGRQGDASDLGKVQMASRHLLGLINGILDLSKIEAGKMELELSTFEVKRMVEELTSTMTPVVAKNGNAFHVDVSPTAGTMQADVTKVRQILFNLLSNAAKFTSHGVVSLQVRTVLIDGLAHIEYAVSDTGIGLTDEHKARLFQPFAQADSSTARKYGGTGLGLALVHRFCELMGGTVVAETPALGGSRFVVCLPVAVADSDRAPMSMEREPAAA
jgi:two-component system sensor histidine kinase/response regulator